MIVNAILGDYEVRQKILIVDDIVANIQLFAGMLESEAEIFFATNGQDAIAVARREMPDLILLDVVMDGMDGYEVNTRLKDDPSTQNIPVIFVTANQGVAAETRALQEGGVDFISKPIYPAILKAWVNAHLKLSMRQRELGEVGRRYKLLAEEMREIATHDKLTGLYNRHHFAELFLKESARLSRSGAPLSVAMLDLDHFKVINDRYGHIAGDAVLVSIAALIKERIRTSDFAFRYGGEEILLVLPDTTLDAAHSLCTDICRLVHERQHGQLTPGSVTVSIGVAQYACADETIETLADKADQALYRAKDQGRNRVVAYSIAD